MLPKTRPTTRPEPAGSFPDLFSGHAALYARSRPAYPDSLMAEIAALAPGTELAWDAGTGNGQAARLLADHFQRVHATNASAAQIDEAEPHPRIDFAAESAERCSLPGASCDLVLAAQALHWFDRDAFYAEARRILRSGGLLAAIGYGWFFVDPLIDEIVGRTLLKPLEPMWASGNWLLIDGYRTIDLPGDELRLDLLPGRDALETLQQRQAERPATELKTVLAELLPKRFAQRLCEVWLPHLQPARPMKQFNLPQLREIAGVLAHWPLVASGTEGYRTAEVTLGGVDTDGVSSSTMQSRHVAGLYFVGEVLDVTGWLGGYNFQWAWASGHAAGSAA